MPLSVRLRARLLKFACSIWRAGAPLANLPSALSLNLPHRQLLSAAGPIAPPGAFSLRGWTRREKCHTHEAWTPWSRCFSGNNMRVSLMSPDSMYSHRQFGHGHTSPNSCRGAALCMPSACRGRLCRPLAGLLGESRRWRVRSGVRGTATSSARSGSKGT